MAVVEKKTETTPGASPFDRLAVASLAGVAYIVASFAVLFKAVPTIADMTGLSGSFAGAAFTNVILVAAFLGLLVLGWRLMGGADSRPGLRAGIFLGIVFLLLWLFLIRWLGGMLEGWVYGGEWFRGNETTVGGAITAIIGFLLGWWFLRIFLRPTFEQRMIRFEAAGWFSAKGYKPGQGTRVRRGTMLGLLVVFGGGIFVMLQRGTLERGPARWEINVPFTGKFTVEDPGDATTAKYKESDSWHFVLPPKSSGDLRVMRSGVAKEKLTQGAVISREEAQDIVVPLVKQKGENLDELLSELDKREASLKDEQKKIRANSVKAATAAEGESQLTDRLKRLDALRLPLNRIRNRIQEGLETGDDRIFLIQQEINKEVDTALDVERERRKVDLATGRPEALRNEVKLIAGWASGEPLPVLGRIVDRFEVRDLNRWLDPLQFRVVRNADFFKDSVREKSDLPSRMRETMNDDEQQRLVDGIQSLENGQLIRLKDFTEYTEALTRDPTREEEVRKEAREVTPLTRKIDGSTHYATVLLLPGVKFALPLLLLALSIWIALRIVNLPTFADFLIATESELNKVSWTTRQRLIQDTLVVLVTMVLMSIFLFVVDIAWAKLLSLPRIEVLQVNKKTDEEKQLKELKW